MNKTSVLLASTTLAFGACSLYLFQALRTERNRVEVLQARLEHAAPITQARTTQPPPAATKPQVTHDAPASAQAFEPSPADSATANPPAAKQNYRRRLTSPTYEAAQLAHRRLSIEQKYPDLATALNLQPEEADRFLDLLAQQELSEHEYVMKLNKLGRLPDEAAFRERQRLNEERQRTLEAERAALLGDAKMHEWNQYVNSLGARAQLRQLRTMLAESNYPLRDD